MITIEKKVRFQRGRKSRKEMREGTAKAKSPPRVPRVAKLMALAIRFDQMIRDGVVSDQAELARLGHVSRARLTQIMNLLNLAPTIQQEVLAHRIESGRDAISERNLRPIAAQPNWTLQYQLWRARARTNS